MRIDRLALALGIASGVLVVACRGPQVARVATLAFASPPSDSALEAMERETTLTFVGTLQQPGVTMPGLPAGPNRWVVRVDSALRTPETVGDFRGMSITVQVHDTMSAQTGSVAVFLAHGLIAGSSLLVREIGRFPVASIGDTATIRSVHDRFLGAASANRDTQLRPVLDSAVAVVAGRVIQIDSATAADSAAWRAGDDAEPRWMRATVQTSGYFRGDSAATWPQLRVRYPGATHTSMRAAAPLAHGDRRIFALRRTASLVSASSSAAGNPPPFTVIFELDVLPMSDSARVFRLTR